MGFHGSVNSIIHEMDPSWVLKMQVKKILVVTVYGKGDKAQGIFFIQLHWVHNCHLQNRQVSSMKA